MDPSLWMGLVRIWIISGVWPYRNVAAPSVCGDAEAKPRLFQSIFDLNCLGWVQVGKWGAEAPTEAKGVSRRGLELVLPLFSLSHPLS